MKKYERWKLSMGVNDILDSIGGLLEEPIGAGLKELFVLNRLGGGSAKTYFSSQC